jgi:integrase
MSGTPRRPRGDGTVYEDKARGRWIGAITIDGRRRKVTGKDKTEARARLRDLVKQASAGVVDNRTITVADAVRTFLERDVPNRTSAGRPLTPATIEVYRWTGELIIAEIGKTRLANLTVGDVERMLDRLASRDDRPLGVASLRKVRGTLQRAISFAERRGQVSRNVAQHATITPSAAPGSKRRALTPDDARTLLAALSDEPNGAMFALMLRVGLRPGEAAGIYWTDIDGPVLNVTRAVRLVKGRAEVVDDLKTESARRTIELPADLADWISEHRRSQIEERLAAESWTDDRLVFASTAGNVLSPPNVRRHLADICARADVPVIRPNELRHSCASLLSDAGVPNEQIADLLGHTTTRMVDSTYRHRLRPMVSVAAETDWIVSR